MVFCVFLTFVLPWMSIIISLPHVTLPLGSGLDSFLIRNVLPKLSQLPWSWQLWHVDMLWPSPWCSFGSVFSSTLLCCLNIPKDPSFLFWNPAHRKSHHKASESQPSHPASEDHKRRDVSPSSPKFQKKSNTSSLPSLIFYSSRQTSGYCHLLSAILLLAGFLSRDTKRSFFLPNIWIIPPSYELSTVHTIRCFSNEVVLWVKMALQILQS